jgi:asparagine synthase (glutamine-hydrolysing)
MGAIALLVSRMGPPDPGTVRRMLSAAPHRGDRQTVEILGQVAVGACNDPAWVTASVARSEGRLVAFCGALDNDADLRAELRRGGVAEPAGPTPAHTLLAAFDRWSDGAIPLLRGSFAGAVTDGRSARCFRDQFGARPLFHHDGQDGYFAATEIKQVLAGAGISREPDLEYLHGVLFGGIERSTAYRGVERIPKWTVVTAGPESGFGCREYWNPAASLETSRLGLDDAIEGTREALERAVRRALTGFDAILLSGGLDAPALAVFAARAPGLAKPVRALTAIYPNYPSADESEWTQMVADHVGMHLHRYVADAGTLDDVERWVTVLDGPVDVVSIPESAESYSVARRLGARMVMNGEIAEMLFESRGYFLDHLLSHGRLKATTRELARWRREGVRRRRIAREVVRAIGPPRLVSAYLHRKPRPYRGLPGWVDSKRFVHGPLMSRRSPRQRWARMQTAPFEGPGIGFEADEICASVCGVDGRRPFTDVDLWEFVLSLPAEVKFPNGRTKPLLREAMRGLLPDELIDRKDKTFFDEFHLAKADYPALRRLLIDSRHRLDGIDYDQLRDRVERQEMRIYELQWARNVAKVHAFLNQW